MAFLTPKKLGQAAVGIGAGTLIYTAPTLITTIVKCIDVCNTTASPITISIHLVHSGGTAGTGNALFYTVSVAGNSTFQWTGTQVLNAGDFIQAVAAGAGLTLTASGGEYVS